MSGVGGQFEGVYSSVLPEFRVLAEPFVFQLGLRLVIWVLFQGGVGRCLLELGHWHVRAALGGPLRWGLLAGAHLGAALLLLL